MKTFKILLFLLFCAQQDLTADCITDNIFEKDKATNIIWKLTNDSLLTISGNGPMTDFERDQAPWCKEVSKIKNVIIEEGVTSIDNYAFYECRNMTGVSIPSTVTEIGEGALMLCGLKEIKLPEKLKTIEKGAFAGCFSIKKITIPDSVTAIGDSLFLDCYTLESVTLGKSVTRIGKSAFCDCKRLQSINLPNSIKIIDKNAFSKCTGLTDITIPSSVTGIGKSAFEGCTGLTSIYVNRKKPLSVDSYLFSSVDKTVCTLYVPKGTLAAYKAADTWKDFGNIAEME